MQQIHKFLQGLALLALLILPAACSPEFREADNSATWYPLQISGVEFRVQLAITQEEMTTGLMHRMELPADAGMLFVYGDSGRRSFWMKNTHIPLDLGFFTPDGILREVVPLRPYELTPVVSQRADIALALEMNRGWFAANDLAPGAQLDLNLLEAALQRRGAAAR